MVGIVIVEAGLISYANAKFAEIFGYALDEVLGLSPLDVVVDADRPTVAEHLRRRIDGDVDRVAYTFRGVRADGDVIDVECHGSCMDVDGSVVLISLLMDITERARAERAVQVLQEQLRDQSVHDALTGLFNRRYLEEVLGRALADASPTTRPVSIIMADLDHFKDVNDRNGHPAGDDVLRAFSATLRRHARRVDVCCRYGGEEFLLVLPDTPLDVALDRAELLRSATAGTPIDSAGKAIAITASFGVATATVHGRTADELIAAADKALYSAKHAGRNRVRAAATRIKPANPRRPSAPRQAPSTAGSSGLARGNLLA